MKARWSVARLMADVAFFAVGMATVRAMGPAAGIVTPTSYALAFAFMVAADRVVFGRRGRAFWLGFLVVGACPIAVTCLYSELADLFYRHEIRGLLVRHAPAVFGARDRYMRQLDLFNMSQAPGRSTPPPIMPEWSILASDLAEVALLTAAELAVAALGGLAGLAIRRVAKRVDALARREPAPET